MDGAFKVDAYYTDRFKSVKDLKASRKNVMAAYTEAAFGKDGYLKKQYAKANRSWMGKITDVPKEPRSMSFFAARKKAGGLQ